MFSKFLIIALLPLLALCEDITFSDNTIGGDLSIQNDIIVSGNTVGEDIIVGGYDDGTGDGEGGLFGDGCSVIGNSVHECDGTSRLMTSMEKKRVNVRLARMQRSKRNMKSKSKKPLRKTRRDMNEDEDPQTDEGKEGGSEGGDDASPCHTCGETGAMKTKNNAKKNNARKNNAKKNVRKNNARKH